MFGLKRRGVRRCEKDTLLPKPGPLPHTSQTEATESLHWVIARQVAVSGHGPASRRRISDEPGPARAGRLSPGQRPGAARPGSRLPRHQVTDGPAAYPGLVAVLADPLRLVIGDRAAKPLAAALDLHTVGDLVGYYPRRYDKRGELTDLAGLREGDYVTVQAEVASVSSRRMQNRKGYIFEAVVTDGRGRLSLTFFGRGRQEFREKELAPGTRGLFSGQVSSFRGKRQLTHPDYELLGIGSSGARAADFAAELIPVYRASSQMPSWKIADSVRFALDVLDVPEDPLPPEVRQRHHLCGY